MSKLMRHVGQDHLGHRLIVVFRELPEDPEHCLVVESSTLPDMYHDNLMNVIESQEAQQTVNLYEVLHRRVFGDGQHMLTALHSRGLLKKLSVDHVNLLPMPNRALPLREANAAINGDPVKAPEAIVDAVVPTPTSEEPASDEERKAKALGLVEQARLLEADAQKYRDQAYELDPSLKAGGRPTKKKKTKAKVSKG